MRNEALLLRFHLFKILIFFCLIFFRLALNFCFYDGNGNDHRSWTGSHLRPGSKAPPLEVQRLCQSIESDGWWLPSTGKHSWNPDETPGDIVMKIGVVYVHELIASLVVFFFEILGSVCPLWVFINSFLMGHDLFTPTLFPLSRIPYVLCMSFSMPMFCG